MPKKSDIPEKILSILLENPSTTREEVAKKLGVTYPAVQKHWRILQDEGFIVPSFHVKNYGPKIFRFWIFMETQFPREQEVVDDDLGKDYQARLCREISESFHNGNPLAEGIAFGGTHILLGGDHDIVVILYSDDADKVGEYVTQFLRSHPAVTTTSTSWSLTKRSNKHQIPV
ncbi:MAG: winged helix-turn-helix transcriptional regulator [Opitutales bacterium]|nr:winged helix-turn-helix transcriptional regulator [Opitutales bacterium]